MSPRRTLGLRAAGLRDRRPDRRAALFADLLATGSVDGCHRRQRRPAAARRHLSRPFRTAGCDGATGRTGRRRRGCPRGPAGSVGKLVASDLLVQIGEFAADLLGMRTVADHGDGSFEWTGAPPGGARISAGRAAPTRIQRHNIHRRAGPGIAGRATSGYGSRLLPAPSRMTQRHRRIWE